MPILLLATKDRGSRSLRDLTQHLTTRADDNHTPPVSCPEGKVTLLTGQRGCRNLVRFFALLRIKSHAPPLVQVPVNSWVSFLRTYSPGRILVAFARHQALMGPTQSIHRLRRGLPGYLILFAPHAFEPQCQLQSSEPPSPLVFL